MVDAAWNMYVKYQRLKINVYERYT